MYSIPYETTPISVNHLNIYFHTPLVFCHSKRGSEIIFGLMAGITGLLVRNLIFISGAISEKQGKDLYVAYFAYLIFVVIVSLFFSSIFDAFESKITTRYLFWSSILFVNFMVGLWTYTFIDKAGVMIIRLIKN